MISKRSRIPFVYTIIPKNSRNAMPINDILITDLHGVGPKAAERLHTLGIRTVRDLVYYTAREHQDLSHITLIENIVADEKCNIRVTIEKIRSHSARRRKMNITEASVYDESGSLRVTWFNQRHIEESLSVGDTILLSGVVKKTKYGLSMMSPTYEKFVRGKETIHIGRIVPQYPLTAGLTQKQMRYFMRQALERVQPITDFLPPQLIAQYALSSLEDALQWIHFPESEKQFAHAQRRLAFDDFLILQCGILLIKQEMQRYISPALQFHQQEITTFVKSLPFTLTNGQRKAAWDVLQDTTQPHPMNRLLIGDVGSGKTVVAAIAMLNTVLNGQQAVLMAPTEILAKQHYETLSRLFTEAQLKHPIDIQLLTGHYKTSTAPGTADIIIGTHALIQDKIQFANLGLAVIDEQHRFGVRQRKALKERSGDTEKMPHLLSMTATPIPRTLALVLYGDLELSIINELPKGRKKIITRLVEPNKRAAAYDFVRTRIQAGEQLFVICPLIEDSEKLEVKSVTSEYERLTRDIFPNMPIALIHGKMKPQEKDAVMQAMRNKEYSILVATSVIEVGVDLPDATMMIIEGAERFGLAQLHQFRGRIGRNDKQSYCLLFTDSDSPSTAERLTALVENSSGFTLAEKDLALRGHGELYGVAQSGISSLVWRAFQQPQLLEESRAAAADALAHDWIQENQELQKRVNAFLNDVHLE